MRTGALRAVAVTLLCALALLVGSGHALAHTRLKSSDPADGASLGTAPDKVSLTFSEIMQSEFSTLTVVGPDGGAYQTGAVTADGPTVSTQVLPLGPAGRYEIGYRVVSDDGHPVTGRVSFTLTSPGPAGAAGAPPAGDAAATAGAPAAPVRDQALAPAANRTDDSGGPGAWPWILGAVVLVGAGVAAALRLSRR